MKKLYRSRRQRILGGVAGGLGEYFGVDPVIIRLIWLVLILFGGVGFLGYLIAWIIIPVEEKVVTESSSETAPSENVPRRRYGSQVFFGIVLVVLGIVLLLHQNWDLWWTIKTFMRSFVRYIIPTLLILLGIYLMIENKTGKKGE